MVFTPIARFCPCGPWEQSAAATPKQEKKNRSADIGQSEGKGGRSVCSWFQCPSLGPLCRLTVSQAAGELCRCFPQLSTPPSRAGLLCSGSSTQDQRVCGKAAWIHKWTTLEGQGRYIGAAAQMCAVPADAPGRVARLLPVTRWCPPPAAFLRVSSQLSQMLFGL